MLLSTNDIPWILKWTHMSMSEFVIGGLALIVLLFFLFDDLYHICLTQTTSKHSDNYHTQLTTARHDLDVANAQIRGLQTKLKLFSQTPPTIVDAHGHPLTPDNEANLFSFEKS